MRSRDDERVYRVLNLALTAIDKPEAERDPVYSIERTAAGDPEILEAALDRCRELWDQNPRDEVAAGAYLLLADLLREDALT